MKRLVVVCFLIWRTVDVLIMYFGRASVNQLSSFSFKYQLLHNFSFIPPFIVALANFDGVHYLSIARYGYHTYEQAFFPFFSILIYILHFVFANGFFISGLILANCAFLGGLFYFAKFLKVIGFQKPELFFTILFLLFFPTSFFFGSVYTEGLFFFLFSASVYYLATNQYYKAAIMGFFAGLTRLIGIFISILGIVAWYYTKRFTPKSETSEKKMFTKQRFAELTFILAPLVGLISYMIYLYYTTGDFLAFYHYQAGFGQHRSTHLVFLPQVYFRYIKIFFLYQLKYCTAYRGV